MVTSSGRQSHASLQQQVQSDFNLTPVHSHSLFTAGPAAAADQAVRAQRYGQIKPQEGEEVAWLIFHCFSVLALVLLLSCSFVLATQGCCNKSVPSTSTQACLVKCQSRKGWAHRSELTISSLKSGKERISHHAPSRSGRPILWQSMQRKSFQRG